MKTTRRRFLTATSTAALSASVLATAAGCSDTDTTSAGAGGGTAGGCGSEGSAIAGNHGHVLTIPQTDVDSAADKTYGIMGSSGHDHDVALTAADFMALSGGGEVTIESTDGAGHTHMVTVSCA